MKFYGLLPTVICMWSGGISKKNPVRPAEKLPKGLTCQTAKTLACHIQFVRYSYLINSLPISNIKSFLIA